ncbi:FXYD domain-containing ion transport regulator 5 isoform X6 [Meles meles]|uniref:FXYD domain-containing ion transport regulator 5 isoform X6 n=1 Tax=Meles meles TaxID=9662 RepID=UPI001E69C5A5|nr:FXYD domain-containing ion transport regulator 5 isoform X6 [Meles meles]
MTEPVSVPARQLSPGHTLRRDAANAAALCPRGCRLGTPGSDMSPSGRLCLLTIVGLILPTRADPNRSNVHAVTPAPGTTQEQEEEIQTPKMQPTEVHRLPATDPRTGKTSPEATPSAEPSKGTTLSKRQSPGKGGRPDPILGPTGSSEDDPFSYDEYTLRKRGLLVAAVLFITGIVILTSGKCRRLPQLCRNRNR